MIVEQLYRLCPGLRRRLRNAVDDIFGISRAGSIWENLPQGREMARVRNERCCLSPLTTSRLTDAK
jgi:hypothetical protein